MKMPDNWFTRRSGVRKRVAASRNQATGGMQLGLSPAGGKRPMAARLRLWRAALALLAAGGIASEAAAGQVPVAPLYVDQSAFLYNTNSAAPGLFAPGLNWQSLRGVPLSSTTNSPAGSDGRAPTPSQQSSLSTNTTLFPQLPPTPGQFGMFLSVSAVPTQQHTNLLSGKKFAQDAVSLGWPAVRATNGGAVVAVLRAAQIGAPYLNRLKSYPFGSVIQPPQTDENGNALTNGANLTYWFPAPYSPPGVTNSSYYYSPNAGSVFATQPGQATVLWERSVPTTTAPTNLPPNVGYVQQGLAYYLIYTNIYLVSGTASKTPQKMYWTEGLHVNTGYPVTIPKAQVNLVNIIYSATFPQYVPFPGDTSTFVANATNTLWFDLALNTLRADNVEGRIFVELLGEPLGSGTRRFLGFEIVDVAAQPIPADVNVELGTRVPAYQDGRDDTQLVVAPLQSAAAFYYQLALANGTRQLYATRYTPNLGDFQCYWLTTGVAGLQWPYLFNRYHEYWPADPAEYVNYARPLVGTPALAATTAVQLPAAESPTIAYQDFETMSPAPAQLSSAGKFYTFLDTDHPAHRTLLQFLAGGTVAYERVFSWLDVGLKTNALLANSVATNLNAWDTNALVLNFTNTTVTPYVVTNTVIVGDRINAPAGELGASGTAYVAGSIITNYGNLYNPVAYQDPFVVGFDAANQGAIIPVNAVPGTNVLEVLWFRKDVVNTTNGYANSYWPAVIGHYILQWPANPTNEIILASNDGSGQLSSLPLASLYYQNNPALPGYNPNEEHAQMLAGVAYALRDDLNITNATGYSSAPYVLVQYLANDGRPAMVPFHVRREAPEKGITFDYVVPAGQILQAPMPLPLLPLPVRGSGASAVNFNVAPTATSSDLPANWNNLPAGSPLGIYNAFTFQDRKHNFWVYRGLHSGLPALRVGTYNAASDSFGALPAATAAKSQPFAYHLHVSRQVDALTMSATNLPPGLTVGLTPNGFAVTGTPTVANNYTATIITLDTSDNTQFTNTLAITVVNAGSVVAQAPLAVTSTNQYSATTVTFSNRPPFLAQAPTTANSFTMRFYYKNQNIFDWPGFATAPTNGAIVPYLLRPDGAGGFAGDASDAGTLSQDIVYRPVWPSIVNQQPVPTLYAGQTLTVPVNNLAAVRGQSSAQVLYQQSIATNDVTQPATYQSVSLIDPTVEKQAYLPTNGLTGLPDGVIRASYQGKIFFPNLPPNLVNRVWLDPNTTNLVLAGQFESQVVGDSYVFLNVLNGADLAAVQGLCPASDPNYSAWLATIANLQAPLYTFHEKPGVPGSFVKDDAQTQTIGVGSVVVVTNSDQQVDSYALASTGPGLGYISYVVGNSINPQHASEPVTVYVARVGEYVSTNGPGLFPGQLVAVYDPNPLGESISFQHTLDLGGMTGNFQYDWRIAPPVQGLAPTSDPANWPVLTNGVDVGHYTLGGAAGIQALSDNFVIVRYREIDGAARPADTNWSAWTIPAFAPGYIKRVLSGINPFEQTTADLFNNSVNTTANILTSAGRRWEGDVALNASSLTNAGLIQIYETVLNRGKALSINAGYNYGPANDALLLAAGELSDLYTYIAADAAADEANPTIGIGTANKTYGDVATALFAFQGEEASLLEEELALLRGRDDAVTTVNLPPVYNRLYWNYTKGIAAGEVIYALNYNILDQNNDGRVDATDASILFPMGHGDAYGHYLTALGNYYQLFMHPKFDWVPQAETVSILGASVAVNYQHERKFAAAAGALAKTGLQTFELTWRQGYHAGTSGGWGYFGATHSNPTPRTYTAGGQTVPVTRYWGLDHWSARSAEGNYVNWLVGNAILPPVDPDPNHEGIQKVDRTTVPELTELTTTEAQLQADMDNAEAGFTPFNLPQNAVPFDINPLQVTGVNPQTHFEQIYTRAVGALNNAVVAFDDAQNVTQLMRSEEDSLATLQAGVASQELAYNNQLIEIYGTPYPDDMGPGGTYPQGYTGPDLIHYTYVEIPNTNTFGGNVPDITITNTYYVDIQGLKSDWITTMYDNFNQIVPSTDPSYTDPTKPYSVAMVFGPDGFFDKPSTWTSARTSPGEIQQAISKLMAAKDAVRNAAYGETYDKYGLDKAQMAFNSLVLGNGGTVNTLGNVNAGLAIVQSGLDTAYTILDKWTTDLLKQQEDAKKAAADSVPTTVIAGLADGGDVAAPAKGAVEIALGIAAFVQENIQDVIFTGYQVEKLINGTAQAANNIAIANLNYDTDVKNAVVSLMNQQNTLENDVGVIANKLRDLQDAQQAYQAVVAKGLRLQSERATYRQHAAALVQGFRTRDAAFRLFQNEKLGRYTTLFNLAAKYAYLAAQAYDYETGLLGTSQGQSFLSRFISSQALGVVKNGEPQYSSSSSGDPGLASALAEMKGDWDVLKGRLGFNNPDGYGTTVSLRTMNYRVLPGSDGDGAWQTVLQNGRVADVTADTDVKRMCLQIGDSSGAPVPGIILNFGTTITDGLNLFGNPIAPGDQNFSASSFATKIFSVGVCLDGYIGMANPTASGGVTPPDPSLDPNGLGGAPYVYLIPVGQDFMRSPPLGDASQVRSWTVDDVAVPLPFNVSASTFASNPFYNANNSLSEPLFAQRMHQAFRPVSTTSVFTTSIYGGSGSLQPSQYSNRRLIGRSIWNSKWKLVIPGKYLLADPNQGLDRFIASVKDVKLYFVTYSYSGN